MRALVVVLIFFCSTAFAQTTFILVRHAEKEANAADPKNPNLTKEGEERAKRLSSMLEKQNVDAIYSTNFNRTKNTVKPLADAKGLTIRVEEPDLPSLKGTIVICGHS